MLAAACSKCAESVLTTSMLSSTLGSSDKLRGAASLPPKYSFVSSARRSLTRNLGLCPVGVGEGGVSSISVREILVSSLKAILRALSCGVPTLQCWKLRSLHKPYRDRASWHLGLE